jgi:hypothetical protein
MSKMFEKLMKRAVFIGAMCLSVAPVFGVEENFRDNYSDRASKTTKNSSDSDSDNNDTIGALLSENSEKEYLFCKLWDIRYILVDKYDVLYSSYEASPHSILWDELSETHHKLLEEHRVLLERNPELIHQCDKIHRKNILFLKKHIKNSENKNTCFTCFCNIF